MPHSIVSLDGFEVRNGINDILINTEVWHEIVRWMWLWLGALWGWSPLMFESILLDFPAGLGVENIILVLSEVWDEIVHWVVWLGNGWGPGQKRLSLNLRVSLEELELNLWGWNNPVIILILGKSPVVLESTLSGLLVVLRGDDFLIFSIVGNEVVGWVRLEWLWPPCEEWLSLDIGIKLDGLLWELPLTVDLLLLIEMLEGVDDVLVDTEVWHGVVLWWSSWGGSWINPVPFVSELVLSPLEVNISVDDIFVFTKVGDSIISRGWCAALWWWSIPDVVQGLGGEGFVLEGVNDILILTEVWNSVVYWIWLSTSWVLPVPFVAGLLLGPLEIFLGGKDVLVLSEVRNEVVKWVCGFLGGRGPGKEWLSVRLDLDSGHASCYE